MFIVSEILTLIVRVCYAVIIACLAYFYVQLLKNYRNNNS